MPGKTPPAGLNMARYNNKNFANNYMDVFGKASQDDRRKGMMKLEAQLIKDAVAIPLWHKKAVYVMQNGVNLPIGSTLRHFYAQSSKTGNSN
jgi:ABC-type transport system substrate-binding protein